MITKLQQKGLVKGFKRTPQRLAILEYLEGNTSHPSAEEVFKAVGRDNPSMSFATVYNTLNTLVRAGALREVMIDPARKRYDPNTTGHHHLICLGCKKVVDVPGHFPVVLPRGMARDFSVIGNQIQFYGECSPCRAKVKKKKR